MNLSESSGLESSTAPQSQPDTDMGLQSIMISEDLSGAITLSPALNPGLRSCNFTRLAQFRCHHFPRADAPVPTFF